MTKLFDSAPEIVITLGSIYFVPQIIENIWRGNRHPLSGKFIGGTLLCKFVLPFLIWASLAVYIIIGPAQPQPHFKQTDQPTWFHGVNATPIPKGFKDSIFGSIPRRPNLLMLTWIAFLMVTEYLAKSNIFLVMARMPSYSPKSVIAENWYPPLVL